MTVTAAHPHNPCRVIRRARVVVYSAGLLAGRTRSQVRHNTSDSPLGSAPAAAPAASSASPS